MNNVCLHRTNNHQSQGMVIDQPTRMGPPNSLRKKMYLKRIDIIYMVRNYLTKNSLKKLYFCKCIKYISLHLDLGYISPNSLKTSTPTAEVTRKNHDFLHILCSY